jgi:hypothetical protein
MKILAFVLLCGTLFGQVLYYSQPKGAYFDTTPIVDDMGMVISKYVEEVDKQPLSLSERNAMVENATHIWVTYLGDGQGTQVYKRNWNKYVVWLLEEHDSFVKSDYTLRPEERDIYLARSAALVKPW